MTNYLAAIDLADEPSWQKIIKTAVDMATGVEGTKIYLMSVLPGIITGVDARYAIRGEMHGSEDYPLEEWMNKAKTDLKKIAEKHIPKPLRAGVVVENGTVYKEIVEAAKDLKIDQIVMGAHRP